MTNQTAISTAGLTKHYPGVQALTDLTLDVPAGSIYGFLGPNGAGKSTTLKILGGLIRPTAGTASVAGIPLTDGAAYRQQVGYLAQEPRFYDWMTGRETLRFVASLSPDHTTGDAAWIAKSLARVGLADAADRRTKTYSGGMRQRLGIAQALIGRPQVVLLDEPVSALDPIGRHEVLDLMSELKGETTVFYSTHILDDVQRVSDHVAILDQVAWSVRRRRPSSSTRSIAIDSGSASSAAPTTPRSISRSSRASSPSRPMSATATSAPTPSASTPRTPSASSAR